METANRNKERAERQIIRARAEIDSGRAWRAKEILGGSISIPELVIVPELLRAYGDLLDRLGDRYAAGKYLFLSGSTAPEHAAAIEVYRARTRKLPVVALIAEFPTALRYQGLGNLPESVRKFLEEEGVSLKVLQRREPLATPGAYSAEMKEPPLLALVAVLVVTGTLMIATVVGMITIARWIH